MSYDKKATRRFIDHRYAMVSDAQGSFTQKDADTLIKHIQRDFEPNVHQMAGFKGYINRLVTVIKAGGMELVLEECLNPQPKKEKKTMVMDASKRAAKEAVITKRVSESFATPEDMEDKPVLMLKQERDELDSIRRYINQVKWCLIYAAKDLRYTKEITHYGCEMPCMNCDSMGWGTWNRAEGRCFWCNKEGQAFSEGEFSRIVVETPKQINWWLARLTKAVNFLRASEAHPIPEVIKAKSKNALGILDKEIERLTAVKTGIQS